MAPRSSSALVVALTGPPDVRLLARTHVDLVGHDLPAQAYHAAAGLPLPEAERLVHRWAEEALSSVEACFAELMRQHPTVAVGIAAVVRPVPALDAVLRSHPLLHLAEGQLSREAVAEAATRAGLPVHYLDPKGRHDPVGVERTAALGRVAGPPWRKEHKMAALAALTALG
ncbi:hypothetical protein FHX44_111561 [Pseudonocardia hierapolitana]|uniref:Uncharacterized protein n=1 Tax=Pseudonocardia hierapolitana TaxID=1128676 RepID=A0A561SLE1_9PSEU|nr:hypothetical protein FHX44_111561 [Pseudonocardia hierapolitana]